MFFSSNRREQYQQLQEFTDTDPMKILKHCSTRWLSLERCVQRTLQRWPALKSYFQSHAECEKPGRINRCMEVLISDEMWLYFAFLEFVLPILNDFNVMFQVFYIKHCEKELIIGKCQGDTRIVWIFYCTMLLSIIFNISFYISGWWIHGWLSSYRDGSTATQAVG